ncbi:unnamed protein product [Rotaria sordida]|uniref:Uncharacterized protein n=1 Tax=Rotaria sordida TaxID=392033 RepID=A0A814S8E0_9BILA|nr:unnamed protein product [Rotaria sordida]
MSYYDHCNDEYSSGNNVYYHNYSVDYANHILGGHHAISSCLPRMRRKHRRRLPKLVRVSTLDQMPILHQHHFLPSLHSQPKYINNNEIFPPPPPLPSFVIPNLPSLESTSQELERRATQIPQTQPIYQEILPSVSSFPTNVNLSSEDSNRPLTEDELRQVQQQQEVFQQHLFNMQRHLLEQSQQQQRQQQEEEEEEEEEEKVPRLSLRSRSHRLEKRRKSSYNELKLDDDQAEIADLIESDPYIAAAMEDFVYTHSLLGKDRHRTYSDNSSSQYSDRRHRTKHFQHDYRWSPSSPSSSSSSSSSSTSSLTNRRSDRKGSNVELILLRELHEIRRLMEEYVRTKKSSINANQRLTPIVPIPWSINEGQYHRPTGIHYPPVPPVTDYQPSLVPREGPPPPQDPNRAIYQNVVNVVREVLDRRSPSQREQPLKPSQIDPKLKHVYTKRPRISSTSMQRTPYPAPRQQGQSRLSQITTPSSNIPPAPPYESLANFSSSRSTTNKDRHLSYGNRQKQSNIYDTLLPGHYLRLNTNKYN